MLMPIESIDITQMGMATLASLSAVDVEKAGPFEFGISGEKCQKARRN
jgi:hypothetical protein